MIQSLHPVVALLALGIISVLFLPPLGISPIVGFIFSGFILGQDGLNSIPDNHVIDLLAELGVVFLLFDIGLHFSLQRIWKERKAILLLGPLQMIVTAALFYAISLFFHLKTELALLLSLGLALSSTAVVTQIIKGKEIEGLPNSDTAIAILIFQDICAIFLLILAHTLVGETTLTIWSEMGIAFMKSLACFAVAIVLGKYLLCPVFDKLLKHRESEVFTMIGLFLILITGMTTNAMGLSLTLGAFLVGMIIAETPFKHILQVEIRPFRFLLLSFFFVTVGTDLHLNVLMTHWGILLLLIGIILCVKIVATSFLFCALGTKIESSLQQAVLLAQGSEFFFVILGTTVVIKNLPPETITLLITAIVASMALSPALYDLLIGCFCPLLVKAKTIQVLEEVSKESAQIIVLGMNEIGCTIATALSDFKIPYFCVEIDYNRYLKARLGGFPVLFGPRGNIQFWENLGIEKFRYIAVAIPNLETAKNYYVVIKNRYPNLTSYIAVTNHDEYDSYHQLGFVPIQTLSVPQGLEIAERILNDLGIEPQKIAAWLEREEKDYVNKAHERHQS